MIPTFLRSLAALVRQLVANGKAVHVTEQTAKELELLAGLEWMNDSGHAVTWFPGRVDVPGKLWIPDRRAATPADLALGWLLASKARQVYCPLDADEGVAGGVDCDQGDYIDRAAVCAELAVIAVTAPGPWYLLSDSASMHTRGTPEGARAAWRFVVEQFVRHDEERGDKDKEWSWQLALIGERYHRELEAMK